MDRKEAYKIVIDDIKNAKGIFKAKKHWDGINDCEVITVRLKLPEFVQFPVSDNKEEQSNREETAKNYLKSELVSLLDKLK